MFHSARLTLAAWYLLIIMTISFAFSTVIYVGATREIDRAIRVQRFRFEHPLAPSPSTFNQRVVLSTPDTEVIEEAKQRVLEGLIGINVIILVGSSLAGYFLAGLTLKPIQEMVNEQKRFVADASHELNTPLTALRTSIEVTLRNNALTLSDAKDALTSNLEEVDNLQALSDELIRLTMHERPNEAMQFSSVSTKAIITSALEKIKTLASKKSISFVSKTVDALVLGDEKSLTEVLVILLDNAIKYSPNKSKIAIVTKKTDGKVIIAITDRGIGIDKKDLNYIFDRFYRADMSRTKQHVKGYGLGLSIAKRIIDLHKGTINVTSSIGKGTTFTLALESKKVA